MRVGVIGAGSMGSVFGGKLARSGVDVVLYDKNVSLISVIKECGLKVRDPSGEFTVRVAASDNVKELVGLDLAVVLVDGNATAVVAKLLPPMLSPDGIVLTLQNGIGNVEALVREVGAGKVLGGCTYVSAALLAPGHAHNTNIGETVVGELSGRISPRADSVAALLRTAGFPTLVKDNAMGHIWSKFALNCALNPLSALTGLRPGEVVRHAAMSELLDSLIAEIVDVMQAKRIILPEANVAQHIRDHAFSRYNKPSMLQHVEAGRCTEIDGLNGALVREAVVLGLSVPVNRTIVALINGIEACRARGAVLDEKQLEDSAAAAATSNSLLSSNAARGTA